MTQIINTTPTVIEEWTVFRIKQLHIGFLKGDGTYDGLAKDGCINDIEVEPESRSITKKCEGVQVLDRPQVDWLNLTINAHFLPSTLRKMDGLTNEGLKTGVYGYPKYPKNATLIITAIATDENQVEKLIAFPIVSAPNGLTFSIDDEEDEVQLMERELRAYNDSNDMSYYEAFINELVDDEVKTEWLTNFKPELVKLVETITSGNEEELPEG